jgi:hypothetical protein
LKLHPEIDPKTTNKEEKEKAKLTYNSMNPFDISNKSANRFKEKEIKEKKDRNDENHNHVCEIESGHVGIW